MKKTVLLVAAAGLAGILLAGCTAGFENINRNPNEVTDAQLQVMNYKTGTNIRTLQSLVVPVEEHLYQFVESLAAGPFAGYLGATPDGWLTKFETFNPSADWNKAPFVDVIAETYPAYRAIMNGTDDEVTRAFASLLRVAIMHRLTDCYGPIPYSKIIDNTEESLEVAYDSQEEVYNKMFEELDAVLAVFKAYASLDPSAFEKYDLVYYGDMTKWYKYANSLKLRMAMRLSYVKPELARQKAEEAVAAGVITANSEGAYLHAAENRMALIYNDWGDHRVAVDLVSYLNGWSDPRREKMILPAKSNDKYNGIRIGVPYPTSKSSAMNGCSNMIVSADTPYLWMNAAEVAFLRAEGALRGWNMGDTARNLYEQGIRLSFAERGADGADAYIADATSVTEKLFGSDAQYQSNITIAWDEGQTEANLERIIVQKWIAIFPLGMEAWAEHRRTGYPLLLPVENNLSGGTVDSRYGARRLTYPSEEYSENSANVEAAVSMLNATSVSGGGDTMGTRVWWDVKPYND